MLYFNYHKKTGYHLQMVIDLEKKTIKKGYCLAIMKEWITLDKKATFEKLYNQFIAEGFKELGDC